MRKWDTAIAINAMTGSHAYARDVKDRLYFGKDGNMMWVYENEYLWAVDKLTAADGGVVFNVPIGHEAFMENVFNVWEEAIFKLAGEVYFS